MPKKKTALTDPDNFVPSWDDDGPAGASTPEKATSRRQTAPTKIPPRQRSGR